MLSYIIKRLLYAIPILIGVNVLTALLFFYVNSPDDMARVMLGEKNLTPEAIENWKIERGYDKPLALNTKAGGLGVVTETVFFEKSLPLMWFEFGQSDRENKDIGREIRSRALPSFLVALPTFIIGLITYLTFAMLVAFMRGTYVDMWGVILCVLIMSISGL
ncbi:MAG: ABC transporter permease, partial [Deltaproteobacteria bacterium]|nr:ABC transporter permease [Deltaproteobacteria bacterium]